MPILNDTSTSVCSICGEPLLGKRECLACLVRGGLNQPNDADVAASQPAYGDFEIERRANGALWELGHGAMGVTYRARDTILHRPVALKVVDMPTGRGGAQLARERFLREARAAAALRHPNVAGVFQFSAAGRAGTCYYAMELVEGETLEARVRRDGPLNVNSAIATAIQVTRALVAAAAHGLIHRDLKPANIMLLPNESGVPEPEVKVIDFGLAKLAAGAGNEMDLTHGAFVGTPNFASPEQFAGKPADARSDIYSLGMTLWYALTGEVPYPGKTIDEIRVSRAQVALPVEQLAERKVPARVNQLLRRILADDPAARPQSARALLADLESCRTTMDAAPRRRQLRRVVIVLCLLLAGAAGLTSYRFGRVPPSGLASPEKSIAILPFQNLSKDTENAFFAAGIQDDVLTSLAQIHDLKVISRTSVLAYQKTGGRSMREIGQALGVANVLEGSVRRAADRVVVNVQLVDTHTDHQLWANHYDNTLSDSLGLQGELAGEIATALRATLSPGEKERLGKRPTDSPRAYEAYLRGVATEELGPWKFSDLQEGVRAFTEAVQLDPGFAQAWARLSIMQSSIYWMGYDQTPPRLAEARKALEKAGTLDANAGQFFLARGYYHYWGEKNYEAAIRDFDAALERLPNSADALFALGLIDRRLGRWEESLMHMAQAERLDPRSSKIFDIWGITLLQLRRFAEARALLDRRLASAPNDAGLITTKAWSYQKEGNLETAAKLLQPLPLQPADSPLAGVRYNQLLYERHFQKLTEMEQTVLRQGGLSGRIRGFNLASLGFAQVLASDQTAARASFLEARDLLEHERQQAAADLDVASILAFVYTQLGDRKAALDEAERALALAANDAMTEPPQRVLMAQIQAQFGDADAALRDLPRLLQTPASDITPAVLRLDPIWDPIRNDPRFQELLTEPAPKIDLGITSAPPAPEKSIAVLPFENLSKDEANAFFAAGIQDDVLTSLAKIHAFKVISRTSVMAFEKPGGRNIREIGRALGVENVLEGSVRREGNRVLLNVQLIDARQDRHIWAERYDRTEADLIGLQGELATQIASALEAKLAPEEAARLAIKPTEDPEAYALYLRALGRERAVNRSTQDFEAAEHLYEDVIKLDPRFALAHARLSIVESSIVGMEGDPIRKAKARREAEEAIRLAPGLGEAHMALGLSLYWADKNYSAALKEFSAAAATAPNEPDIFNFIAGIYRRQGRWRDSLAAYERAQEIDPRDRKIISLAGVDYLLVRDWPAATACFQRALEIAPDSAKARIGLAYLEVFRHSDPAAAGKILQEISPGIDPDGEVTEARWDLAMQERDYPTAEKILTDFPSEEFPDAGAQPKAFYLGRVALARGDHASAQRYFAAAVPGSVEWVRQSPNSPTSHAWLGLLYAYQGHKEEALREGRRAVELEPENQNAFHGAVAAARLALIYARTGEVNQAINLIERLLATPGPVEPGDHPENMTLAELRLRWEWDPLRKDPRFQKILAGPEPKTTYQ